jgi:hypothetical protein
MMHTKLFSALLVALALLVSGCSLVVDSQAVQCAVDSDCRRFKPTARCVEAVCIDVVDAGTDSGMPITVGTDSGVDGGTADAGTADGGAFDAGFDAGVQSPPGCFRGVPTTDLQFANACTTSSYLTFNNCQRIGLCDGGIEFPIEKPDGGTTVSTTPLDAGSLEYCYDAVLRPKPIFMNGSTNFTPFIRTMVPILAGQTGTSEFTLVWQPTSSCTGADTAFSLDATRRVMRNPTSSGQSFAAYYTPTNLPNGTPCRLGNSPGAPAAEQELVDIGQSDIFASSCPVTNAAAPFNQYEPSQGAYADVKHFLGPIQSMVFVVPYESSQRVISAEAARLVFGLGGSNNVVVPWVDKNALFVRAATTGTNGIISRGIDVPSTNWWGIDQRTAPNLVNQIKSASVNDAEKTIGTLSIDFADREKDNMHILYFQPKGALAGFLPDAQSVTREKQNVRDGHYPLWGPIHLYARQVNGVLTDAAGAFITNFSVPRPDQRLLDATIEAGSVPACAMRVTRDAEMGPLRPNKATFQCHCYYEKKLNGSTSCKPCAGPADCTADRPACSLNFCERNN